MTDIITTQDRLPIGNEWDWDTLERWGFIKDEVVGDHYYKCTFPTGWKIVLPSYYPYTLIDARGLRRAWIELPNRFGFHDKPGRIDIVKRFVIERVYHKGDYDTNLRCDHMEVIDRGLSQGLSHWAVLRDTPTYSGVAREQLVIVKNGVVYHVDPSSGEISINTTIQVSEVTLLTNRQFFDTYHNKKVSNYPYIRALVDLSEVTCKAFLSNLPTDDSIWGPEYDYPEVGADVNQLPKA